MILICLKKCYRCDIFKKRNSHLKTIVLPNTSYGVGDTFAKITTFFGLTPCASCKIRQSKWNKYLPYFWKKVSKQERSIKQTLLNLNVQLYPVIVDDTFNKLIPLTQVDPKFDEVMRDYDYKHNIKCKTKR